jgi:uncharacterized membrane protein (DUF4010 family)
MDIEELFSRFAVALGIGLLIGLERGWTTRDMMPGGRAAGIRTFAITGLLGAVVGATGAAWGEAGGAIVLGLCFVGYAIAITVFAREQNLAAGNYSATTAIAAMATFALGAYALVGDFRLAAAAAVAIAVLLALRQNIHQWVAGITWIELRSALLLLAMTFVALPVIPQDSVGPFGGVNPREIWLTAIVLAGVSFVGYGAVKYLGDQHGVLVAAAAGGLASSTAVTVTNAKRARSGEGSPVLLAAGAALATAVSMLRVAAIVTVLKPALLLVVGPPLVAAGAVAAGYAVASVYWRHEKAEHEPAMKLRNPFGFWAVVGFASMLGAIVLIGRALGEWFGATGVLAGAAFLGLGEVDAVTVSMVRLDSIDSDIAGFGVLLAVASNTLSKLAIGVSVGRGRFAAELAAISAGCVAAAVVVLAGTFALR